MAMAVGIFTGTGMEARAEEEYEIVQITKPASYTTMKELCDFDSNDGKSLERKQLAKEWSENAHQTTGKTVCVIYETQTGADVMVVFCQYNGDWNATASNAETKISPNSGYGWRYQNTDYIWYLLRKKVPVSTSAATTVTSASSAPHTHSYSWVTVQEANAGQDGIEEYRCSCGNVQERCVIPRYMVIVKGLFGEIKNAPQNGTVTFDSGRLYTISDYVIKKLAERTDVTTVITFEYQNQAYKMTIPAGVDYTSLLTDEDYFYGYFYFANAVGATIESL